MTLRYCLHFRQTMGNTVRLMQAPPGGQSVTSVILLVAFCFLSTASGQVIGDDNKNCTFGPGICPVTKENVVDVFYFDVADDFSCQEHCADLEDCHFFTMYGIQDSPKDHMKCFMFRTCDHLEPCDECTTGETRNTKGTELPREMVLFNHGHVA